MWIQRSSYKSLKIELWNINQIPNAYNSEHATHVV